MMKNLLIFWIVAFGLLAPANASDQASEDDFDEKIKAVNVKVLEKGAAEKARDALWQEIRAYWSAFEQGDFTSIYEMHVAEYQGEVSLASFLKRKRFEVNDFHIKEASFWGEECVRVVYQMGVNSEGMQINKLPLRQYWVLRAGVWKLYENPYRANPMFSKPSKVKPPCPWPAQIDEKSKK